jgi:hypothetical protein
MGKSNTSKKVSSQVIRKFVREKLMWRRICIATATLFIGSIFIAGPNMEKNMWAPITTLVIYALSMIIFRIKSQCPYCGKRTKKGWQREGEKIISPLTKAIKKITGK